MQGAGKDEAPKGPRGKRTYLWVIKYKALINICVFRLYFLPVLFVPRPILGFVRVLRRISRGRVPSRLGRGRVVPQSHSRDGGPGDGRGRSPCESGGPEREGGE
jgi:hypothetical protein